MRTAWLAPTLAYFVLVAVPGCTQNDPLEDALRDSGETVGAVESPIQGGYLDETDTHVVGLIHLAGGGFGGCTGTLIAPNVVLTARHCIAPSSNGGVICGQTSFAASYEPGSMYITTRTSFTQNPSDYYQAKEIFVPNEDPAFCGFDQAVIVLDEPIPDSVAKPVVPRVDSAVATGEEYYAIGYGQQYDSQNAPSGTRYRRDGLFTQCVGDGCPAQYVAQEEFVGDTGICSGDSGGPAMDMQHRVVGVASRGGEGCVSPVYGHVLGHAQWIKDVTGYATSSAGIEVPPWAEGYPTDEQYSFPVGDACNGPADCLSNACLNGYCTRPCTQAAYCPDSFLCGETGYCEEPPPPPPAEDDGGSTVTSCTVGGAGQDPTKPIPWVITPLALGALLLLRRKRSA